MTKILLIEDDPITLENTADILRIAQYNVITAANCKEGNTLAKAENPDLIISDIMMPGLDGFGFLHILSKDPDTASIPFIFLTAKTNKDEFRKGMELGADDYLTKPFDGTELLNAIEVRLRKAKSQNKIPKKSSDIVNKFLDCKKEVKSLGTLSPNQSICRYSNREVVFHAGDNPHYLYFINKGKVKTHIAHNDGKEYITNIYKKGEFFGLPCLLENRPYTGSAIVLEDSEICKIPKSDILDHFYEDREISSQFIKYLIDQLDSHEKKLVRLAYDNVRKRTAEAILQVGQVYSEAPNTSCITISREDLARVAGTAPETVIRCLGEFKEDGFIKVKGREITILNFKGLESIQ